MKNLRKTGFIGIIAVFVLSALFYLLNIHSYKTILLFIFPFLVMLMISFMKSLRKIGLIGSITVSAICLTLHLLDIISYNITLPFVFPFVVMFVISFVEKRWSR